MKAKTIDEVVDSLGRIITDAQQDNNPMGYFAALYRGVTISVREGIRKGEFEDNARMERLDVVFANRYLEAYAQYQQGMPPSRSWEVAFDATDDYWPIVLQHLLLGMNAHINLDLGIAAATVSPGARIDDLKGDFMKINDVLASLVGEVENDLAQVWPTLRGILRRTRKVDDFLVNFSMKIARDGAWRFARELALLPEAQHAATIAKRDADVAKTARLISHPGAIPSLLFGIIRLRERGSVAERIQWLAEPSKPPT